MRNLTNDCLNGFEMEGRGWAGQKGDPTASCLPLPALPTRECCKAPLPLPMPCPRVWGGSVHPSSAALPSPPSHATAPPSAPTQSFQMRTEAQWYSFVNWGPNSLDPQELLALGGGDGGEECGREYVDAGRGEVAVSEDKLQLQGVFDGIAQREGAPPSNASREARTFFFTPSLLLLIRAPEKETSFLATHPLKDISAALCPNPTLPPTPPLATPTKNATLVLLQPRRTRQKRVQHLPIPDSQVTFKIAHYLHTGAQLQNSIS